MRQLKEIYDEMFLMRDRFLEAERKGKKDENCYFRGRYDQLKWIFKEE